MVGFHHHILFLVTVVLLLGEGELKSVCCGVLLAGGFRYIDSMNSMYTCNVVGHTLAILYTSGD